jgi:hypothetical protein
MKLPLSLILATTFSTTLVLGQTYPEAEISMDVCKGESYKSEMNQKRVIKQCLKEASRYKRGLIKKMLKEGALGEALRVLLKRKKKFLTTDSLIINAEVDEEITKLSDAELSELIVEKLKTKVNQSNLPKYDLIFPIEISVENNEGKICKLDMKAPPQMEIKDPTDCKFCKTVDVMKNFVDDCAYFTSEDLSEEDALSLLGGTLENKSFFCHNKNVTPTDLTSINNFGDQICEVLESGDELPQLEMISTRNLYRDKTVDLAKKRGDFIKKYLFQYLTVSKNNCGIENDIPEVLTSYSAFEKKFQSSPLFVYEGNKTGDYGPNPYAKSSEYENEIKRYRSHLEKFITLNSNLMSSYQLEIKKIQSETNKLRSDFSGLEGSYNQIKENEQDVTNAQALGSRIASEMLQINNAISLNYQKISNLVKKLKSTQIKLLNLNQEKDETVKSLIQFYLDPVKNKQIWDEKIFNEMKMAKLSFTPVVKTEVDDVIESFDPEVRKYLKAILSLDAFACKIKEIRSPKKSKMFTPSQF